MYLNFRWKHEPEIEEILKKSSILRDVKPHVDEDRYGVKKKKD